MTHTTRLTNARPTSFDVVCAGEPVWRATGGERSHAPTSSARIVDLAKRLAQMDLRVAVATVLDDDRRGRSLRAEMAGSHIDVSAVTLAPPAGIVVVDGVGGEFDVLDESDSSRAFDLPEQWSSQVLLLCGVSPLTGKAAALCRAARRARRRGTSVVLDAAGSMRQWAGREPRMLSMVIREAHVVRCSFMDLAILGTDAAGVRSAMRDDATLLVSDDRGTTASGPFGDVRVEHARPEESGDDCTASVCRDLARRSRANESAAGRWDRVLRQRVLLTA